jgi:endonuclease YncB( thermonuclease family)
MMGYTFLKYVKGADRINKKIANGSRASIKDKWADIQLIASGNNIVYIVNGKVVASTEDDKLKKGAVMFAVTSKSELCIDDIVIKKEGVKEEAKKVETSNSDPTVSKVIEVTHGDKLIVDIAEPHELAGSNIKVSLKDIDAPDATRSCPKQMELGLKVKDYVTQKLENASSIKLTNFRKTNTKIISQVIVDGTDLGEELVSKGYASEEYGYWKPYFCSALSATNQADQYVDTDEKKAIFWYERSIVLDPDGSKNQESHFTLSQMYSNFGNADKSLENLKKSASLEWIPAMEQLGSDYLNGNGVKKDPNQGKKLLKKAFDKGSQRAEDIYCGSLPKAKQKTCKF